MKQTSILWPMCAQAALTAAIWLWMYMIRLNEIRVRHIDPQSLSDVRAAAAILKNTAASDNFRNLFEVPVLFLAVCLAMFGTGLVTPLQVGLAWAFVGLRTVHSLIHVTYNRVTHRFAVYVASTLCVFLMWGLFAYGLWLNV